MSAMIPKGLVANADDLTVDEASQVAATVCWLPVIILAYSANTLEFNAFRRRVVHDVQAVDLEAIKAK